MCWSGEASAVLAFGGLATSAYCWRKGEPASMWVPLAYFSSMEALQAFTYGVIDQCGTFSNQASTIAAYVHISFQPIFINMLSMGFVPRKVAARVRPWAYAVAILSSLMLLARILPVEWLPKCFEVKTYTIQMLCPSCSIPIPLCGKEVCSVSGSWHIAWQLPLGFHPLFDNAYLIAGFLLPLLYGAWRITIYLALAGPFLAYLTTSNPNEWPAVWCLFSIAILGIAVKTSLRKHLTVRSWYGLAAKDP